MPATPQKLSVSTQLFDRALLNRNGVMDIWNMAHVEDGEKYYIRKEYTEVSELQNSKWKATDNYTASAHSNGAAGRAAADTASGSRRTSRRAGRGKEGCKIMPD